MKNKVIIDMKDMSTKLKKEIERLKKEHGVSSFSEYLKLKNKRPKNEQ